MFGIIVGTHGQFAPGILQSCAMIYGERDFIKFVTLVPGEGTEDVFAKYEAAIKEMGNPDRVLILNDLLGGTLEMLALGWMNVGAAIALAVPLAAAGQVLTIFVRTITVFFRQLADKYADEANMRGIEMCHFAGLILQALCVALPAVAIALIAGSDTVNNALASIPEAITHGLQVAGGFIVVVGYAMVINMMNAQKLMVYFFLGFLIAVFTDVNLVGFGALGAVLAYFHIRDMQKDIAIEEVAKTGGGGGGVEDDIDDSDLM